jgi:hypothetical protein
MPTKPVASAQMPRPYVFARATAFSLECPYCGAVDVVRGSGGRRWRSPNFNPVTRRWQCRQCRRLCAIGLAVWPVAPTGNHLRREARGLGPLDADPKPGQVKRLRELHGIVRRSAHQRNGPVNLMGCPCLDRDDVDPACPFHSPDA